jgi:ubiquinone/menaquinone biosynthesis C-methylase UbiE
VKLRLAENMRGGQRSPFDELAASYDGVFTDSLIGRAQRNAVWQELDTVFDAGSRILEIGCGTGVDACHLASRGMSVVASDRSIAMLNVAEERVYRLQLEHSVALRQVDADQIEELSPDGLFDGAFSNFGVFNCVENLKNVPRQLSYLLRPKARLLICFIGPFCLWETLWYLSHGQFAKALRRLHPNGVETRLTCGGKPLKVCYPSISEIARSFAPEFRLTGLTGIGIAVPPSYLEPLAKRFRRVLKWAINLDRLLGRLPGIRVAGDHILLCFERRQS